MPAGAEERARSPACSCWTECTGLATVTPLQAGAKMRPAILRTPAEYQGRCLRQSGRSGCHTLGPGGCSLLTGCAAGRLWPYNGTKEFAFALAGGTGRRSAGRPRVCDRGCPWATQHRAVGCTDAAGPGAAGPRSVRPAGQRDPPTTSHPVARVGRELALLASQLPTPVSIGQLAECSRL